MAVTIIRLILSRPFLAIAKLLRDAGAWVGGFRQLKALAIVGGIDGRLYCKFQDKDVRPCADLDEAITAAIHYISERDVQWP